MRGALQRLRAHRGAAAICLLVQLLLGLVLGGIVQLHRNTLERNGRWISTKTDLERSVIGARSFFRGRQALAGGHLNLGAWFGYQEVIFRRPLELASLELDFLLQEGAYLAVLFNKTPGRGFAGVRLSRMRLYPSIFFEASEEGRFLRRERLAVALPEQEDWSRLRIDLADDRAELRLGDVSLGGFSLTFQQPQTFGFRGGWKRAFVDRVVVRGADGEVVSESFEVPAGAGATTAAAVAVVLLLNLSLLLPLAARARRPRLLLFSAILANGTLAVTALLFLSYLRFSGESYLLETVTRQPEAAWRKEEIRKLRAEIRSRHAKSPAPGVHRLLFIGSSQTWGSGALRDEEVWVNQTCEILNGRGDGPAFECVNGGISSARAQKLARILRQDWSELRPHSVVVDLSNNDKNLVAFERGLREMIALCRRRGMRPVFVQEPISPEHGGAISRRHQLMQQIGAQESVPVIDMQGHLWASRDVGFLWWDRVHLTSLGQRLFAEHLVSEFDRLGITAPQN